MRISVLLISLLLLLNCSTCLLNAQDTITFPLKIKIGVEVLGPALYFSDKNIFSTEGHFSVDLNEKRAASFEAGYANFKYSQYNYTYNSNGIYARTGFDFNILKPKKSQGLYWGGIGLRYGISRFSYQIPTFEQDNYWGTIISSTPASVKWGHFIEVSPGMRAEVFNHFSMGWSINIRALIYSGVGKDLRPIYIPGFGNSEKRFSTGISYFFAWNIPYKKIRVIIKKEVPEETDDIKNTDTSGTNQQNGGIRQ